jgi:hypothetical protein
MKLFAAICLGATGVLLFQPRVAQAHHSNVAFDERKEVELKGVVKEFTWTNPHTRMVFTVVDEHGQSVDWELEGRAPGVLIRSGWGRDAVKPGQPLSIVVRLARNGSKHALIWIAKRPDGTLLSPNVTE